jgi:hypothetical protein
MGIEKMTSEPLSHSQTRKRSRKDDHKDNFVAIDCPKRQCLDTDPPRVPQHQDASTVRVDGDQSSAQQRSRTPINSQDELSSPCEPHFVHQPLQLDVPSIRLVEVLAPSADGTINCAIRHVTLEDPLSNDNSSDLPLAGRYWCVSYVWGPPDQTRWITIDGRPFEVRYNLWEFLNAVSTGSIDYVDRMNSDFWYWHLWIDALCIDQENGLERNHQVQQMGRIFSSATWVVAWLGADLALGKMFEWMIQELETPKGPPSSKFLGLERFYNTEVHYAFQAFVKFSSDPQGLYNNTYWRRAWIVQEVLLARKLFFLANYTMVQSRTVRRILPWLEQSKAKELRDLMDHTKPSTTQSSPRLIENLELFHYKDCTDVRDRIYSVLSVSCDGPQLSVNYDCSLVETMRNTLGLDKANICLQRVFVLLEALHINYTFDDVEACLPIMAQDGRAAMRHAAPCARCGEDTSIFSPRTPKSTTMEERYICLHCNHSASSSVPGTHQRRYPGHLCVKWDAGSNAENEDRHLFWMPAGGGRWHELQSYKYIVTNDAGTLKRIILSVGLLCELKALVAGKGRQGDTMQREYGYASQSALKSDWRVVK